MLEWILDPLWLGSFVCLYCTFSIFVLVSIWYIVYCYRYVNNLYPPNKSILCRSILVCARIGNYFATFWIIGIYINSYFTITADIHYADKSIFIITFYQILLGIGASYCTYQIIAKIVNLFLPPNRPRKRRRRRAKNLDLVKWLNERLKPRQPIFNPGT